MIQPTGEKTQLLLNCRLNARGGCRRDWNVDSHAGLISGLQNLIKANPSLTRTKLYLMDNLIEDGRYSEAEAILAELLEDYTLATPE